MSQPFRKLEEVDDLKLEHEWTRRRLARETLRDYARSVDIPGRPINPDDEESLFHPIESAVAKHHLVIMDEVQATMETPGGRLMILAPPGSAKSTYCDVVAPSWAMCRNPGYRIILASYAQTIARKQSRRARQLITSKKSRSIWPDKPHLRKDMGSIDEWGLSNGSEFMCAGILAGVTGNRANGIVCDDLIAGREEAESPTIREKIMDAYRDDLETRLLPGGWIILINTRWHMDDPSGQILPLDYDGRTGVIRCQDGRDWLVLNLPAKCERTDDPVGRRPGEYLWPEWFPKVHWQGFERDPKGRRRWNSLYQQRPTSESGEDFDRSWFHFYEPKELPKQLTIYGASDYAVTELDPERKKLGHIDWTEHGVVGVDSKGDLWFLDWWSGQKETDVSVAAWIALVKQWRPVRWWHEGGVIDKAITPLARLAMRQKKTYVRREALPSMSDKRAKCQSFQGMASARCVHLPAGTVWANELVAQLTGFPGHRYDDKYDVAGLIGRGVDKMHAASEPQEPGPRGITPFTAEWLEWEDPKPRPRHR